MTPHVSGTTLSAQARYAAGTREILECWFEDRPIREEYLIVDSGKLAGTELERAAQELQESIAALAKAAVSRIWIMVVFTSGILSVGGC